jgi:hypothetical protein
MKSTSFAIVIVRHRLVCGLVEFPPKFFLQNCHFDELGTIGGPEKYLERSDITVVNLQRLNISKPRLMEDQDPF